MDWFYATYLIFLHGSAAIAFALAALVWRKRSAPGTVPVALLLLAISTCTLGIGMELSSADLVTKIFWNKFQYLGIALIPAAWLVFVLQYTGRERWVTSRLYALLSIEPLCVVLLVWTNDWHHLLWSQVYLLSNSPLAGLRESFTPAFYIHATYAYLLLLSGLFLLILTALNSNPAYRRQYMIFVASGAIPVLANFIDVTRLNPLPYFEWTPPAFTLASLLLGWGIHRFWLFDLLPVARGAIIDGMAGGVVVLDLNHRVVDLNLAASRALGRQPAEVIGQPAGQVFADWPDFPLPGRPGWVEPSPGTAEIRTELALEEGELLRFYELRISSLMDRRGLLSGYLVVWSDISDRKRAQVALHTREERYRQSVENSPIPLFSVDRQGTIRTWNEASEKAFQYSQEILGRDYHQLLHNLEDKPTLDATLARVFERELSLCDIENSFRCKDGSLRFMVSRLYPVLDDNGGVEACFFANTDISERRGTEEALRRQSVENARLFEDTQRRLQEVTLLSRVITLTASAADLPSALNQVCSEVARFFDSPQTAFALLNPEGTAAEIIAEYQAAHHPVVLGLKIPVEGNPSMSYILEHKVPLAISDARSDPLLAPVHEIMRQREVASILLVPILIGEKVAGTLGIDILQRREFSQADVRLMQDIASQISQALERLNLLAMTREQARQVQQIMDTVPEGVLLLDAAYRIVLANPAAWQFLSVLEDGFDPNEPLSRLGGWPVEDLCRAHPEPLWQELETSGPARRFFEVAARPQESMGHQEGLVLVMRDVTQERENQSRIQIQDRLATVGQLAAGIAHDFNNIMSAIVVYADLLSMQPDLQPASRERLGVIQQQIQRASSLIRQILDFSRRSVMEPANLDLLPFIKELDRLLGRVLPENIRLELTYQPGIYMVNADPTRLQQVFMNLALNARDAMPSGGTLQFELQRLSIRSERQARFPGLSSGDWICIRVGDTGTGIPAEVIPYIFDPFFTTKPVGQGTGLGLAQVYGIIQQHGGVIDVTSRPGEGTTFMIYLKALQMPVEAELLPEPPLKVLGEGETVLVAEDDQAARVALQALLETQNYRVLAASNGVEALGLFEREEKSIDLVVSDVVMPEMGGMALFQQLRRMRPQVKVLFVTGHPLSEENQALLEDSQVRWLQKPFSVKEFTSTLNTLLREPA